MMIEFIIENIKWLQFSEEIGKVRQDNCLQSLATAAWVNDTKELWQNSVDCYWVGFFRLAINCLQTEDLIGTNACTGFIDETFH